jgi:hypothetical protein
VLEVVLLLIRTSNERLNQQRCDGPYMQKAWRSWETHVYTGDCQRKRISRIHPIVHWIQMAQDGAKWWYTLKTKTLVVRKNCKYLYPLSNAFRLRHQAYIGKVKCNSSYILSSNATKRYKVEVIYEHEIFATSYPLHYFIIRRNYFYPYFTPLNLIK